MLYFVAQKYYPIKYELGKILKICLLSMIIFLTYVYIPLPYASVAKLLLLVIYLVLLYVAGFFETKEIQTIKSLIKGFHGKISTR